MVVVALVLFVLARYRSPQLAGAAVALAIFPGLIVSPVAGALLDRRRKATLVTFDYAVAAATSFLVAILAGLDRLPAPVLLAIIGVSSLTSPLSFAGARSLVPIVAPRHLWERANALDSAAYVIAFVAAAPLAGTLVGLIGGGWTIGITGFFFAAAAVLMAGLPEPSAQGSRDGSVVTNAWRGLRYVVGNPSLRGIALTLGVGNAGSGVIVIALPVLVLVRMHEGPAAVGLLWGISGAAGLVSALLVGRVRIQGREREMILLALAFTAVALALLPLAQAMATVVVAMVVFGLATGPFDVSVFTLRQRRADPAWFGRVFAVSMALNSAGSPIGSALAGPLIARSLDLALWTAVAFTVLAAAFPLFVIPARDEPQADLVRA